MFYRNSLTFRMDVSQTTLSADSLKISLVDGLDHLHPERLDTIETIVEIPLDIPKKLIGRRSLRSGFCRNIVRADKQDIGSRRELRGRLLISFVREKVECHVEHITIASFSIDSGIDERDVSLRRESADISICKSDLFR